MLTMSERVPKELQPYIKTAERLGFKSIKVTDLHKIANQAIIKNTKGDTPKNYKLRMTDLVDGEDDRFAQLVVMIIGRHYKGLTRSELMAKLNVKNFAEFLRMASQSSSAEVSEETPEESTPPEEAEDVSKPEEKPEPTAEKIEPEFKSKRKPKEHMNSYAKAFGRFKGGGYSAKHRHMAAARIYNRQVKKNNQVADRADRSRAIWNLDKKSILLHPNGKWSLLDDSVNPWTGNFSPTKAKFYKQWLKRTFDPVAGFGYDLHYTELKWRHPAAFNSTQGTEHLFMANLSANLPELSAVEAHKLQPNVKATIIANYIERPKEPIYVFGDVIIRDDAFKKWVRAERWWEEEGFGDVRYQMVNMILDQMLKDPIIKIFREEKE